MVFAHPSAEVEVYGATLSVPGASGLAARFPTTRWRGGRKLRREAGALDAALFGGEAGELRGALQPDAQGMSSPADGSLRLYGALEMAKL